MSGDGCARFLPQAIEAVKEAIALDDAKKFEEAHAKYQHALERFVTVISLREHLLYFCCCNSAPEFTWMTYLFFAGLKVRKESVQKEGAGQTHRWLHETGRTAPRISEIKGKHGKGG